MNQIRKGPNPWRIGGWLVAAILVLMPLVTVQLVPGFNWGVEDFVAAAALIGMTGLAIEAAVRITHNPWLRIVLGIGIFLVVATVWAQLSVGIFQ